MKRQSIDGLPTLVCPGDVARHQTMLDGQLRTELLLALEFHQEACGEEKRELRRALGRERYPQSEKPLCSCIMQN